MRPKDPQTSPHYLLFAHEYRVLTYIMKDGRMVAMHPEKATIIIFLTHQIHLFLIWMSDIRMARHQTYSPPCFTGTVLIESGIVS